MLRCESWSESTYTSGTLLPKWRPEVPRTGYWTALTVQQRFVRSLGLTRSLALMYFEAFLCLECQRPSLIVSVVIDFVSRNCGGSSRLEVLRAPPLKAFSFVTSVVDPPWVTCSIATDAKWSPYAICAACFISPCTVHRCDEMRGCASWATWFQNSYHDILPAALVRSTQ